MILIESKWWVAFSIEMIVNLFLNKNIINVESEYKNFYLIMTSEKKIDSKNYFIVADQITEIKKLNKLLTIYKKGEFVK